MNMSLSYYIYKDTVDIKFSSCVVISQVICKDKEIKP